MPKLPLAVTAIASALSPWRLDLSPTQTWAVGYLQKVNKDGSAIYVAPAFDLRATVNAKGLVQPPADRPAGVDCFGKTLEELRAGGRVMEFKRTQ